MIGKIVRVRKNSSSLPFDEFLVKILPFAMPFEQLLPLSENRDCICSRFSRAHAYTPKFVQVAVTRHRHGRFCVLAPHMGTRFSKPRALHGRHGCFLRASL